jgi:hypothetical protein
MLYLFLSVVLCGAAPQGVAANLPETAKQQGLNPDDFRGFDGNVAVTLEAEGSIFVIVVQTGDARSVPEHFNAQVVLLDQKGTILDRLRCATLGQGRLEVNVHAKPEADGAYVVFRYIGSDEESGYRLYYHGKECTFGGFRAALPMQVWKERGPCRLGIADKHFTILFPELLPDLKAAKQLRVDYWLGGEERQLLIEDARVLAELDIKARIDYPLRYDGQKPTVTFIMEDASLVMWFQGKEQLVSGRWGVIQLESAEFYEAISIRVDRAERQPVELLQE